MTEKKTIERRLLCLGWRVSISGKKKCFFEYLDGPDKGKTVAWKKQNGTPAAVYVATIVESTSALTNLRIVQHRIDDEERAAETIIASKLVAAEFEMKAQAKRAPLTEIFPGWGRLQSFYRKASPAGRAALESRLLAALRSGREDL